MRALIACSAALLLAACAAHQPQPVASRDLTEACKPVLGPTQVFASQQQLVRCDENAPAITRREARADQAGAAEAQRVARVNAASQRQQVRDYTDAAAHPSAGLRRFEADLATANQIMATANSAVACKLRDDHWYAVLLGGYSAYFNYEEQISTLDADEVGGEILHANAMMAMPPGFDCQALQGDPALAKADAAEQQLDAGA